VRWKGREFFLGQVQMWERYGSEHGSIETIGVWSVSIRPHRCPAHEEVDAPVQQLEMRALTVIVERCSPQQLSQPTKQRFVISGDEETFKCINKALRR
jgi:hypothetical protein